MGAGVLYSAIQKELGFVDLTDSAVDSRITFTRSSNRTYFDAAGVLQTAGTDVWPREFDPATGRCLGRSVWGSATNLSIRSEELDDAAWATTRASVSANAATAPDGTTTADKLVEDSTASNTHLLLRSANITVSSGVVHTISIYAKAAERSWFQLQEGQGVTAAAYFDVSNGVVGTVSGTGSPSAAIQNVGGGWFRCSLTFTSSGTSARIRCYLATGNGGGSYSGDGSSGLYLWGAQLEAQAFASPYIPTTSATVTRSADNAVISTLSSIGFNASEGTLIVDASTLASSGTKFVAEFGDATANNRIGVYVSASLATRFYVRDSGADQGDINAGSTTVGVSTFARWAAAYKLNDLAASVKGGAAGTDTSATIPTVDRLRIGARYDTFQELNGYIRRILCVPRHIGTAALPLASRV